MPERIEPAHMWIQEQAQGSGNLFSDSKLSGDIFAGAKGLAGGSGGLGWKGGCPGNSIFNSKFPQPHPVRLGWVGAWGWLRACRGSSSAEKAVRVSSPQQDDPGGFETAQLSKGAAAPPLSYSVLGLKGIPMSNGQVLLFDGWWGWRRAQKIYFPILNFQGHFCWC